MKVCGVCGKIFGDEDYQVVVFGLGSFDRFECAERAQRRDRRAALPEGEPGTRGLALPAPAPTESESEPEPAGAASGV